MGDQSKTGGMAGRGMKAAEGPTCFIKSGGGALLLEWEVTTCVAQKIFTA